MIRTVKIVFGVFGVLATACYLVVFIGVLAKGDFSTRGLTEIAASVFVLCAAAAITVWLLKSAFQRR